MPLSLTRTITCISNLLKWCSLASFNPGNKFQLPAAACLILPASLPNGEDLGMAPLSKEMYHQHETRKKDRDTVLKANEWALILVHECMDVFRQKYPVRADGTLRAQKRLRYALVQPTNRSASPSGFVPKSTSAACDSKDENLAQLTESLTISGADYVSKAHNLAQPSESLKDEGADRATIGSSSTQEECTTASDKDFIVADVSTYLEHVEANNQNDFRILAKVQTLRQWWEETTNLLTSWDSTPSQISTICCNVCTQSLRHDGAKLCISTAHSLR